MLKRIAATAALVVICLLSAVPQAHAQTPEKDLAAGRKAYIDKKYAQAITALGKVVAKQPENVSAYSLRAMSFMAINSFSDAINDWDKAIGLMPTNASFYYQRALAKQKRGDAAKAIDDLESATLAEPGNVAYQLEKARLYDRLGRRTEAVESYQQVVELDPNNSEALTAKLNNLQKMTQDEKLGLVETAKGLAASGASGALKPVPDDQNTLNARKLIADTKFTTMAQARRFYDQMAARTDLAAGKKRVLLGLLREKVMTDVYGAEPYKEEVEQMKTFVETETWINPEGRKHYFNTVNDSKYWFSGGVQRGATYVYYKVMKSKFKPRYQLQMYAVKNNESNLVYNSDVAVSEDSVNRVVDVFASQNKGYMWAVSKTDYLRATTSLKNTNLMYTAEGSMGKFSDMGFKNQLPKAQYDKFVTPENEYLNAAIRATLQHLIIDYVNVLNMPK
jgi:hypothetical protein